MKKKHIAIAVPLLWTAIVFILHVMPVEIKSESSFRIPHADKAVHFCMFASLCFFYARSFRFFYRKIEKRKMIIICLLCILFGATMEIVQGFLPLKRDSDIFDWFADIAGTISGLVFATSGLLPFVFRHEIGKPA